MKITNEHGISLPLAVWLLHDDYDYVHEPNYISATRLLKGIKQSVLSQRVDAAEREMDLSDFIASRFGHAVHDGIEKAWKISGKDAMKRLGYAPRIYENIIINPEETDYQTNPNLVPVWIERRAKKIIAGHTVGGKFDLVIDGRLFDFKSTSVWAYIFGGKDEDYKLQGSIYRWLNPELITDDYIYIQFVFTDWQRSQARRDPDYPQVKVKEHRVELMSIPETETWIKNKLRALSSAWNLPEEELPPCNDKELWRSETKYKYFSDPNKTDGRATRNFDNLADANKFMASKGGKGTVLMQPGEVKACEYCPAFTICKQKDRYYA